MQVATLLAATGGPAVAVAGEHLVVPVVLAQIHIVLAALRALQLIGMVELQQYWMKVLYMEDTHNECR
jgi:hypothetical protein